MDQVDQIEQKLHDMMAYRTALDEDFAEIFGVAVFTTSTRIYPIHRCKDGDYYDSRGLDDFEQEALDYDISVNCQPYEDKLYLYTVEIKGGTSQHITPELTAKMKRAMVRRLALNLAHALIYISDYSDLHVRNAEDFA